VGHELAALRGKADAAEEALLLGVGFTRYSREAVAQELNDFGWEARTTKASGDQGVDVIATKGGKRVVLQCKLYTSAVGNAAVQEIFAAKQHERADYAAVVTSVTYTKSARQLASTTGVLLLHHDELWIKHFLAGCCR
jgi:HJR/Mrr/RecB family endonuclease